MAAECLQQPEKSMRGRVPVLLGMSPIFQVVMSGRLDLNQQRAGRRSGSALGDCPAPDAHLQPVVVGLFRQLVQEGLESHLQLFRGLEQLAERNVRITVQ